MKAVQQKQIDSRCELRSGVKEWLERLADLGRKLLLEWVLNHCGVDGNEEADAEASGGGEDESRRSAVFVFWCEEEIAEGRKEERMGK